MILAIETATDVCSVAYQNDEGKTFEKRVETRGSHSEKLFLFIRDLMDKHRFSIANLSAVLVSAGPGSYTGLRIAASGIKGLLFGRGVPLWAVSTMASFACSAIRDIEKNITIHSIIDARRVHVYHQQFEFIDSTLQARKDVQVIPIEAFEKMVQPDDIIIGTGLDRLNEKLVDKVKTFDQKFISACSLMNLYNRREAENFIDRVSPRDFDPKYYTSSQVS